MEWKLSAAQRDAIILDEVETWLNIWNPELRFLLHDWKTSHSMAQMRSVFAKSMGILGIKNMHRLRIWTWICNLVKFLDKFSTNNKIMPPLKDYMEIYHQTCHRIIIVKIIIFMHIFHETKADFGAIGHLKCMYLQILDYLANSCWFQKCVST